MAATEIEGRLDRLESIIRNALNVYIPTPEQAEEEAKAQAELVKEAEKEAARAAKEAEETQAAIEAAASPEPQTTPAGKSR